MEQIFILYSVLQPSGNRNIIIIVDGRVEENLWVLGLWLKLVMYIAHSDLSAHMSIVTDALISHTL